MKMKIIGLKTIGFLFTLSLTSWTHNPVCFKYILTLLTVISVFI